MDPRYQITLKDEHLALLGRIGATWAQIDYFLMFCIAFFTNTSLADCGLLLDRMTSGGRINLFNKLRNRIDDAEVANDAETFYRKHGEVLGRRNHLTHGIWGLYYTPGENSVPAWPTQNYAPACWYPTENSLLYASELPDIANKAAELSHPLSDVVQTLGNSPQFQAAQLRMYFGHGQPPIELSEAEAGLHLDLTSFGRNPSKPKSRPKPSRE